MSLGYKPDANNSELSSNHEPSTQVYAVHGADPEVQAYGMAKYSRSALSMRESLAEINDQKAEKFLNTFYFQYGHRSIADLAHIAFAIERLSILAATVAVDEPRWDGQERSTRYQDFQKSGYYVPDFGDDAAAAVLYRDTIDHLFAEYRHFSEEMFGYLRERTPKPAEMKQEAYERTLRARAFDLSRYLLPLATNTSLGQIVSARTLENQVSRLLSHTHAEVRHLGELLRRAAQEPAYDVSHAKAWALLDEIARESPELAGRAGEFLMRPIRVAPTLMKYAEPNAYEIETRRELQAAAKELLAGVAIEPAPTVDLLDGDPLEIELATTLLYQYSHHPYRQIRDVVSALPEAQRREIIDMGLRHRGRHDEVSRALLRRAAIPLRHPDGHWRLSRHASPSPLRADRAGLHHGPRLRRAGRDRIGRIGEAISGCDGARARYRGAACGSRDKRSRRAVAIRHPAGLSQAHAVQDGPGRGDLYQRAADGRCRALLLSQRGLRDVRSRGATLSIAGDIFPRDRRARASGLAKAVGKR